MLMKYLIILIGHIIIGILDCYVMSHNGIDTFQILSFIFAHAVWHNLMKRIFRIYGLK
jgi:hypothetical protein